MKKQVKSKERINKFGEVYTSKREVLEMINLIKPEIENINKKILEPTVGTGNFLIEIIKIRMKKIKQDIMTEEVDKNIIIALSNIYGVEIQKDNLEECKSKMYKTVEKEYKKHYSKRVEKDLKDKIKYILDRNIVLGDMLTGIKEELEVLVMTEWEFEEERIIERQYALNDIYVYSGLKNKRTFVKKQIIHKNFKELGDKSE